MDQPRDHSSDVSSLSPSQKALLGKRLRERLRAAAPAASIPRLADRSSPALAFAQERMWFLQQLDPTSPVYNRPVALRLTGRLHVTALEKALGEIVHRHEALRARFPVVNGETVQVIAPELPLRLPVVNLDDIPLERRQPELERLLVQESRRVFDLSLGPIIRASLYRMAAEEHVLLMVMHHIVFDAWSARVLVRELADLYAALLSGDASPLPDLPIQYADWAQWQRDRWPTMAQLPQGFWKRQLAGLASLNLPTDRPRPRQQTLNGAIQSIEFSPGLAEALRQYSRQGQVTLFVVLLAAFQVLLHRYSGADDIAVGSPVAGRNQSGVENLIGAFINTLVLRGDLSGDPSFRDLVGRTRNMCLEALEHQDVPFEELVKAVQSERDLSSSPLFQVMFNLENVPRRAIATHALNVEEIDIDFGVAPLDLTAEVSEEGNRLICRFEYNTDLFDDATIRRMLGHYRTVLESVVANPDRRISELQLLTDAERHQLLIEWNATDADYPRDKCIHELFEEQAQRTPDAIAVVFEDKQMTYRELNGRANRLARHLLGLGVGRETLVGIYMPRSFDMLVSLMGILKAGCAYVPLDPAYPRERLDLVLRDAKTPIVLTQKELRPALPADCGIVRCLDSEWNLMSREDSADLGLPVKPENLAYVIYTSGSTGRPKGVLIEHGGLVNHAVSTGEIFGLVPADRFLQFAPISFDASAEEIFPPLASGAAVVLRTDSMIESVATFLQRCRDWSVTVVSLPTAYWHEMAMSFETESATWPAHIRLVILGGESAGSKHLRAWQQLVGDRVRLVNTYGPTEITIECAYADLTRHGEPWPVDKPVPVGRPLANTRFYVLDGHGQPVPVGVPGELYVGGAGVARGYLNAPELSAAKFVPEPFDPSHARRAYRTGDVVRYLADGNLEFLGRIDQQVKIRGYRVELGEVTAALTTHPNIQAAVALLQSRRGESEDAPNVDDERQLVAFYVPRSAPAPSGSDVYRFLKQILPDYMLPAAYVAMGEMPRTPNGKLDVRALPDPANAPRGIDSESDTPQTRVEKLVADIWSKVLGVGDLGLGDNFFEHGGDSLKATRVCNRIRHALMIDVPLRHLFEFPTIGELSRQIEDDLRGTDTVTL